MCEWSDGKIIYENKNNPSSKIVERDMGCGATDSGDPVYGMFKIKTLIPPFVWANRVDTDQIDKSEWKKVGEFHGNKY